MNRFEKFHLLVAILGLVLDIIALIGWAGSWLSPSGASETAKIVSPLAVLAVALIGIYSWFSISWIILRQYILFSRKSEKKDISFSDSICGSVLGVGVLLFPLFAWTAFTMKNVPVIGMCLFGWVIIFLIVGFGIGIAIACLMPLIYEDM